MMDVLAIDQSPLQSHKARAKLTRSDVLDIYKCKGSVTSATALSKHYGVSEKAVRDIWTGRTWSKETWHLYKSQPYPAKKMGRPIGRKDAQPRKQRSLRLEICSLQTSDHLSSESQSTDIEPIFSMMMNEWPKTCKKSTKKVYKDTEEVPYMVLDAAVNHRAQSIDDLLHEKALHEFDTSFEDPFGPDWAAVHCSSEQ